MTTTTLAPVPVETGIAPRVRRVGALAAMELRLLWRNRTALTVAVGFPPLMVLSMMRLFDSDDGARLSGAILVALLGFAIVFVPYYNLTTTAVARREDLMLKKLVTGETSQGEVLVGMAVPALVILVAQTLVTLGVVSASFEPPAFVNPALAVLTVLLATVVFALLACASSGVTRSVESAQLTTMPLMLAAVGLSGLLFPLSVLPPAVERVAALTPLAPVVELLHLSVTGIDADGAAVTLAESFSAGLVPLAVLLAWVGIGLLAARRWMRWDTRR